MKMRIYKSERKERPTITDAELDEFDRATEAIGLADLRDPTPIRLDDGRWFLQHDYAPAGYGWYFTSYDPETREGKGWFGSDDEPSYYFEDALVPEYLVNGEGSDELIFASRNCGIGPGCFWSEWQ